MRGEPAFLFLCFLLHRPRYKLFVVKRNVSHPTSQQLSVLVSRYQGHLSKFVDNHMNANNGVRRTPGGLGFVAQWGSLRHAASAAGIISLYGRGRQVKGNQDGTAMMEYAERQVCFTNVSSFMHVDVLHLSGDVFESSWFFCGLSAVQQYAETL